MFKYIDLRSGRSVVSNVTHKPDRVHQAYDNAADGLVTFVDYDSYKKLLSAAKSGDDKLIEKVSEELK
jgi:hypothetical protein